MSPLTLLLLLCLFWMRTHTQTEMSSSSSNRKGGSSGFLQTEPTWEAKTKGYTADFFYFGKGMDRKFLSTAANLEDYVGEKYGSSTLTYMKTGAKKIRGKPPPLTSSEQANQTPDDKEIRGLVIENT